MGTIVISGCATGIGAACRKRLEADGNKTIGIDIKDAEIIADLSIQDGRKAAITETLERCGGAFDGLLLCAASTRSASTPWVGTLVWEASESSRPSSKPSPRWTVLAAGFMWGTATNLR